MKPPGVRRLPEEKSTEHWKPPNPDYCQQGQQLNELNQRLDFSLDFRRFWTGNKTEDQFCINCCKYHKSSNIFHLSFLKVLWSSHFKIKSNWHDYSTNSILSAVNFYIHLMCLSLILHSYNTNRHVTWSLYYTILGVTAISKKLLGPQAPYRQCNYAQT